MMVRHFILACLIHLCLLANRPGMGGPPYLDPERPVALRVRDLLSRMTLEEKLGQLNIPCVYKPELGGRVDHTLVQQILAEGTDANTNDDLQLKWAACQRFVLGTQTTFKRLGPGGGLFGFGNNVLPVPPDQGAAYYNTLQRLATKETRLGIPLLQVAEGTHGLESSFATIFPEGLALGSTFNRALIQRIYATVMHEARTRGIHALCTLVIEPNIDPRMGRNAEAYSEDPYLCAEYARAIVTGIQGTDIAERDKGIAVLCHFPGQSNGLAGLEFNAVEMSERAFRTILLPPWEAGIRDSQALMVMATHPSIDVLGGVPAHASHELLTGVLRQELNFQGVVLGEGNSVRTILWKKVCETQKQAGRLALNAGLDVSISLEPGFMADMYDSVMEGSVAQAQLDQAVARLLRLKFRLGLFENPYVTAAAAPAASRTQSAQNLALQAAQEGIVLLKNEDSLLPLTKTVPSIAVIGPLADAPLDQLGDYIPKYIKHDIVTPLAGIRARVSAQTVVTYVKGVEVLNPDFDQIEAAVRAAKQASVAIVCVGETAECNGEKKDVATLDLLGRQRELIQAVHATGTPTVVVLVSGRPLTICWTAEHVPAVLAGWFMGEQGGHALADILFGDINPSGRLPISFPRHVGQLPAYYFYKPSKAMRRKAAYVDMPIEPLYDFGYGLSYTTFKYDNLAITPEETGPASQVTIRCDVTNTGRRTGTETAQLYINDAISSTTTPVRLLKGFQRIMLNPGETKQASFVLTPYDLSLLNRHLERVVEPGVFDIMVGKSCEDIQLRGQLTVTSPTELARR
jgi:beta-glucosidase